MNPCAPSESVSQNFLLLFCAYLRCHFLWLTCLVSRNPSLTLSVMDKAIGQRELVFTLVPRKTFQKTIMGSQQTRELVIIGEN